MMRSHVDLVKVLDYDFTYKVIRRGLKRDILISLAYLMDFAYAHTYKNQMRRLLCGGWYQKSSFGTAMAKLLSVGEIEKIEKNGQLFYRLTSQGLSKLKEDVPLLGFIQKPWDGLWRIVIFDIREGEKYQRESLRAKLLSLGFGMWQKSVYLSPHPIEKEINQYLRFKKLFPFAVCLVTRRSEIGDDKTLANYVWGLDRLNEEYETFIDECQKQEGNINLQILSELWLSYKELVLKDPYLPKELLPVGWFGQKARFILKQLYQNVMRSHPVMVNKS